MAWVWCKCLLGLPCAAALHASASALLHVCAGRLEALEGSKAGHGELLPAGAVLPAMLHVISGVCAEVAVSQLCAAPSLLICNTASLRGIGAAAGTGVRSRLACEIRAGLLCTTLYFWLSPCLGEQLRAQILL